MRKKILTWFVLGTLCIGLAGCHNAETPAESSTETIASVSEEAPEEASPASDTEDFISLYESKNLTTYYSGDKKKTFRYLQLNHDAEIHYVSYREAVSMLQEGKQFALYYGWAVCPYCRSVIEPLFDAAAEDNIPLYVIRVQDGKEGESRSKYELQNGEAVKTYTNQDYDQFISAFGENIFLKYYLYDEDDTEQENGIDTGARQMYAPTLLFAKDGSAVRFESEEWSQPTRHGTASDREHLKEKLKIFLETGEQD